jgi:2-amino-4-hydroxy-6-hydroxymethyldihydropteridine diphosphokinase
MTTGIYLSLGSNLGNREAHLTQALQKLQHQDIVGVRISSFYETEPVDVTDQPDFLNLACQVNTGLAPLALLGACQQVESGMQRLRKEDKGPRNIDIDIILYDQQIIDHPQLKVPHPHWSSRNFVLIPLQEIAPHLRDPVSGHSLEDLLAQCPDHARVNRLTTTEHFASSDLNR